MVRRLGLLLPALLLVAVLLPGVLAAPGEAPTPADDLKGAATSDPAEPRVPATTQLGMLIMVMLVMAASSSALLGGGIFRSRTSERPATASPKVERVEVEARVVQAAKASPKSMAKRSFANHRRVANSDPRKGWNTGPRRGAMQSKPRRRGGPGCRGVR